MLPYLAWMIPLVDRMVAPKRQALAPGLGTLSSDLRNDLRNDLKQHMAALQAIQQVDITPAIQDQQRRLEKLEEHAAELNHSLNNLSEDQLDLADQVRALAGWVRNSAVAGLFLLTLMFILKLIQAIHGMGH
jgi:small-conductance mechanosensitive channel